MFHAEKAAQMAAYFLALGDGRMAHLKLMKLLYLAERKSLELYGHPMSGDKAAALPHGPVLTRTLDLLQGNTCDDTWEAWISDKENHEVALKQPAERDVLDELSDADIEILDQVWNDFGHMSQWQVRDYTHEHCPEWIDPGDSSLPISYLSILLAVGKSSEDAELLSAYLESVDEVDRLLQSV